MGVYYLILAYHSDWGYQLEKEDGECEKNDYSIIVIEFENIENKSEDKKKEYQLLAKNCLIEIIKKYQISKDNGIAYLHGNDNPFPNDFAFLDIPTVIYTGFSSYAYCLLDKVLDKMPPNYQPKADVKIKWDLPEKWEDLKGILDIEKKKLDKCVVLIKHRISHLFLPLVIDLQGIAEVRRQKSEEIALEYLEEVLVEKRGEDKPKARSGNPPYYRQKLADLWFMVAKYQDLEFKTQKPDQLMANGQALIDLIANDKKDKIKQEWEKLLRICGQKYSKNNPFNKEAIQKDKDSWVYKFMCKLDECVKNQKINSIDEILKYEKLDNNLSSNISNLKSDITFHWWFCKLNDCLEKLSIMLKEEK